MLADKYKNEPTENSRTQSCYAKASHVLAVDDSPDNLLLMEAVLGGAKAEYHVTCAGNGTEALNRVSQAAPDIILLDVSMPDMTGHEVTRRIRQNNSLPYIPILLVTANDRDSCHEGFRAGADDFIRKPYRIEELEAKVMSLLRFGRSVMRRRESLALSA